MNRINSSYLVSEFCHFVCVGLVGTAGGAAPPAPAPPRGGSSTGALAGPEYRWGPGRGAGAWQWSGVRLGGGPAALGRPGPQPRPAPLLLPSLPIRHLRVLSLRLLLSPIWPPAARASALASGRCFRDPRPCGRRPGGDGAAPRPVPPGPWGSPAAPSAHRACRGPQKWQRPAASRRAEGSPEGAGVLFLSFFYFPSFLPFFLFL